MNKKLVEYIYKPSDFIGYVNSCVQALKSPFLVLQVPTSQGSFIR